MLLDGPPSWRQRSRPQPVDEAEDFSEQLPWHRNLRQLESDVAAMSHDLGADLDELLPKRRHRPAVDLSRQRQTAQEVAEVVGQGEQLKADRAEFQILGRPALGISVSTQSRIVRFLAR